MKFSVLFITCLLLSFSVALPDIRTISFIITTTFKAIKLHTEGHSFLEIAKKLFGEQGLKMEDVKALINDMSHEMKKEIQNLEYSIEYKHFHNQVKNPMKRVFRQVQKLYKYPTNETRNALAAQCSMHPPLSILESLIDMLEENWLIIISQHYHYESTKLEHLEQMLDQYIAILAISQGACSGLHADEAAEYDFKQLKELYDSVAPIIKTSRATIHKSYFQYTKHIIKNFLPSSTLLTDETEKEMHYEIAINLLKHFETNYNYGVRYGIRVGSIKERTFNGTIPHGSGYQVIENGFNVLVLQLAPSNDSYSINQIWNHLKDIRIRGISSDVSLGFFCHSSVPESQIPPPPKYSDISHYRKICGEKFICLIDSRYSGILNLLPSVTKAENDVYVSNGQNQYVIDDSTVIIHIALATEADHQYLKLKPTQDYNVLLIGNSKFVNENFTVIDEIIFLEDELLERTKLIHENELIFNQSNDTRTLTRPSTTTTSPILDDEEFLKLIKFNFNAIIGDDIFKAINDDFDYGRVPEDIENIKNHSAYKFFYQHVKYPMRTVYHQIEKFFDNSMNVADLRHKCSEYPPLKTLRNFENILRSDFIFMLSEATDFESTKLEAIEKMIDECLQILVISQITCSNFYANETVVKEMKILKNLFDRILPLFQRSRDMVHKSYFVYTKTIVKRFIPIEKRLHGSKQMMNLKIAHDLLKHFESHYNYGARYGFRVTRNEKQRFWKTPSKDHYYRLHHNGFNVFVFEMAPLNDSTVFEEFNNVTHDFSIEYNERTKKRSDICNTSLLCLEDQYIHCAFQLDPEVNDIYATNGRSRYERSPLQLGRHDLNIYAFPFQPDHVYQKLHHQVYNFIRVSDFEVIDENYNLHKNLKKQHPEYIWEMTKKFCEIKLKI